MGLAGHAVAAIVTHTSTTGSTSSKWVSLAALVIAVAALGLAVWDFRSPARSDSSAQSSGSDVTDQQRAEDKQRVCAAFDTVRTGVSRNTNIAPPGGEGDVSGTLAVAANARVSLLAGGQYLYAKVTPATPPELGEAVKRFADVLTDVGAAATAGIPNTDATQAGRLRDADALNAKIIDLCR